MTSQEFDTLYRKNYPILYRLAFTMLRNDEECRDLISDVFADLLDNVEADEIENIDGYLFRTVRNRALSVITRQKTLERARNLYPIEQNMNGSYDHDYDRKLLQVMQFLDSGLTPNARHVMRLVFEQGCSYKEAAGQSGVSVAAINKHVVKSLRLLRENFKQIENQ